MSNLMVRVQQASALVFRVTCRREKTQDPKIHGHSFAILPISLSSRAHGLLKGNHEFPIHVLRFVNCTFVFSIHTYKFIIHAFMIRSHSFKTVLTVPHFRNLCRQI